MGCGASGDARRAKPTDKAAAAPVASPGKKPAGSLDYKLRIYSFNDIYTIDNMAKIHSHIL